MSDPRKPFTTFLNLYLPQTSDAHIPCTPEELFVMRVTLFTILKKNNFQVLYGPDFTQNLIPITDEEEHLTDEESKRFFTKWKKGFYEDRRLKRENPHCPASFLLIEDTLSIVARGFRETELKMLICFTKSGAVKKEEILNYETYIRTGKYDRCWVIAEICTAQSKNFMQRIGEKPLSVPMQFVPYKKLKSDWTKSSYVHQYRVMSKKEQEEKKIKKKDAEQYPKILITDSACLQTLADVGDILESIGPSPTADKISQYKLVIPR
jgi:DNA-directed RNA polymerase subunit H (RpoH/RPB5)